jgi:hypothetical protein
MPNQRSKTKERHHVRPGSLYSQEATPKCDSLPKARHASGAFRFFGDTLQLFPVREINISLNYDLQERVERLITLPVVFGIITPFFLAPG